MSILSTLTAYMVTETQLRKRQIRIGANIQRLREQTELSRQQFADEVGTKRGYIHELEKGLKSPSVEMLAKIAIALSRLLGRRVTESDLLSDAETREPAGAR